MTYTIAANVAYVFDEEASAVYAMALPDGAPQILRDTSAQIWLSIADGTDPIADMVEAFGDDHPDVAEHSRRFIDQLVALNLVKESDD